MVLPQSALLGREECGWLKTVGPQSLHRVLHCLCSSCYTVERPKADCTSCPQWKNTNLYKTGGDQERHDLKEKPVASDGSVIQTWMKNTYETSPPNIHRRKSWATKVFSYEHLPRCIFILVGSKILSRCLFFCYSFVMLYFFPVFHLNSGHSCLISIFPLRVLC